MIYHLFKYLESAGWDFPGISLMRYLSFRAMLASVMAVVIALFAGKKIIAWLQKKQIGEEVRELGLEGQLQKKGTPTIGGIIIILSILVSVLLFCDLTNIYVQLLVFSTLWCGALGFADDYVKVFRHNKEGVSEKTKLIAQIILGFAIGITVWMSDDIVVREKVPAPSENGIGLAEDSQVWHEDVEKNTKTTIPFVKNHEFDYKVLSPFKGNGAGTPNGPSTC